LAAVGLTALVLASPAVAVVVPLNLTPPSNDANRLDLTLTVGAYGSKTDTTDLSGTMQADLLVDFDPGTLEPTVTAIAFVEETPGKILATDVHFSYAFGLIEVDSKGMKVSPNTPVPYGPVQDGRFSTLPHEVVINGGSFDARIPGSTLSINMADEQLRATTDATAEVDVALTAIGAEQAVYDVRLLLPMAFDEIAAQDPETIRIAGTGVIEAVGQLTHAITGPVTFTWDGLGDGLWGEIDAGTGNSRWLNAADEPFKTLPGAAANAVVRIDTVTVAEDRAAKKLTVGSGTVAVADGATLSLAGDLILRPNAEYVCELGGATNGLIAVDGDAYLPGKLGLQVIDVAAAAVGTTSTYTILTAAGPEGVGAVFDEVPAMHVPGAGTAGHLGLGVFHGGVRYVDEVEPGGPAGAVVDVYNATGGDGNGDGAVDGQDITRLITHFSRPGDPADRTWTENDTAGGTTGRGDGNVDGQDITDLISSFTGDPGPGPPDGGTSGSARAEYDPATGEFTVWADGVMNWTLNSDGLFGGPGLDVAGGLLADGGPAHFVSANGNTVGEGTFDGWLFYAAVSLGSLTKPGTDADRFTLEYVDRFGGGVRHGEIHVVPEPAVSMLLAGALILLWIGRQAPRRNMLGEKELR